MLETKLGNYTVGPTGDEFGSLEPVRLSISKGAFHFQDYLTVEDAMRLAAALTHVAIDAGEPKAEVIVEAETPAVRIVEP